MAEEGNGPKWVQIDKYRLDEELAIQASLALKFGDKYAEAQREVDRCESALELIEAEVGLDVRRNPTRYNAKKGTDKETEALVILDKRVQEAKEALHDAKRLASAYKARVTACEHRKKALDGLVYLHGQTYFAGIPNAKKYKGDSDE